MEGEVASARSEGTPQGSPLSPLLSNILLGDLDRELERRGHRFCRYADDCNIYVQSDRAGQRVRQSIAAFLEQRLKLKINAAKSAVARPWERKFLGYSMTWHRKPKLTEVKNVLEELDGWLRRELRTLAKRLLLRSAEPLLPVKLRHINWLRHAIRAVVLPPIGAHLCYLPERAALDEGHRVAEMGPAPLLHSALPAHVIHFRLGSGEVDPHDTPMAIVSEDQVGLPSPLMSTIQPPSVS